MRSRSSKNELAQYIAVQIGYLTEGPLCLVHSILCFNSVLITGQMEQDQ